MSNIFKFHRRTNSGGPAAIVYGGAMNGGFYAGDLISSAAINSKTKLIVSSKTVEVTNKEWGSSGILRNINSDWNGWENSNTLNAFDATSHPAANYCRTLTSGGYSDWYLPALNELEICYRHLKPTTNTTLTGYGANPYNIISQEQSSHDASIKQTTIPIFQSGNTEAFQPSIYITSSEGNDTTCGRVQFNNGVVDLNYPKSFTTAYVRPCRRA